MQRFYPGISLHRLANASHGPKPYLEALFREEGTGMTDQPCSQLSVFGQGSVSRREVFQHLGRGAVLAASSAVGGQ